VVRGQWQTALVTSWPLFAVGFVDIYNEIICCNGGLGSSIGIATDYRLDGPGSNIVRDDIFRQFRPALGPTQPPVQWVLGLSRG